MKKINVSKDKILYTALSFVVLGILLKTYDYLNQLEKCQCYHDIQAYHNLKIDIDFLKAYQIFEMFLVIMFITILYCGHCLKSRGMKNTLPVSFLSSSVVMLLAFVTGYLSYHVFLLYSLAKEKCKCVDKWQKYFIYVQGIMGSVTFMRLLFLLIFVFLLLL
jgi:hypothetical protein